MVADANAASDQATAGSAAGVSGVQRDDVESANRGFSATDMKIDIGAAESIESALANITNLTNANAKRTYDAYQDLELTAARRSQDRYDDLQGDISLHRKNMIQQYQQNSRGSHNDQNVSVDRVWNVDEVAQLVAKTPVFLDAIAAAVAAAVNREQSE